MVKHFGICQEDGYSTHICGRGWWVLWMLFLAGNAFIDHCTFQGSWIWTCHGMTAFVAVLLESPGKFNIKNVILVSLPGVVSLLDDGSSATVMCTVYLWCNSLNAMCIKELIVGCTKASICSYMSSKLTEVTVFFNLLCRIWLMLSHEKWLNSRASCH